MASVGGDAHPSGWRPVANKNHVRKHLGCRVEGTVWKDDKVDRLRTEPRPDVLQCVGLETDGVGGRGVV